MGPRAHRVAGRRAVRVGFLWWAVRRLGRACVGSAVGVGLRRVVFCPGGTTRGGGLVAHVERGRDRGSPRRPIGWMEGSFQIYSLLIII